MKKKLKLGGFIRIPFCNEERCAEKLKKETSREIRGALFGRHEKPQGVCAICKKPAKEMVYIAKSY